MKEGSGEADATRAAGVSEVAAACGMTDVSGVEDCPATRWTKVKDSAPTASKTSARTPTVMDGLFTNSPSHRAQSNEDHISQIV